MSHWLRILLFVFNLAGGWAVFWFAYSGGYLTAYFFFYEFDWSWESMSLLVSLCVESVAIIVSIWTLIHPTKPALLWFKTVSILNLILFITWIGFMIWFALTFKMDRLF